VRHAVRSGQCAGKTAHLRACDKPTTHLLPIENLGRIENRSAVCARHVLSRSEAQKAFALEKYVDDAHRDARRTPPRFTLQNTMADTGTLKICNLAYSYPGGEQILSDFSLDLPAGSRCLLSGANGAGKTTLLQILAGKTMVSEDCVRVIGRPPFHDINLTCSGELGYLGSQWRRNIGSAGSVALSGDFRCVVGLSQIPTLFTASGRVHY
jgi:hypothetical protein